MGAAAINNKKELIGMFKIYNFIEIMLKHAYSTLFIIMIFQQEFVCIAKDKNQGGRSKGSNPEYPHMNIKCGTK